MAAEEVEKGEAGCIAGAGNQSQQMSFPWTSGQNRMGRFGEGPGMPSDPFGVSEGAKPARKG